MSFREFIKDYKDIVIDSVLLDWYLLPSGTMIRYDHWEDLEDDYKDNVERIIKDVRADREYLKEKYGHTDEMFKKLRDRLEYHIERLRRNQQHIHNIIEEHKKYRQKRLDEIIND